ncbi:MAG: class I SAM-dependent methyltransferase [Bacteroidota bacterium]
MERKVGVGVWNIIRFNWHFYMISLFSLLVLTVGIRLLPETLRVYGLILLFLFTLPIVSSLLVSFYVYDLSRLYEMKWLEAENGNNILNVNAGFDETSAIIKSKYPHVELSVCDFYDREKHTEISIRRARKVYPPYAGTLQVKTHKLPFVEGYFDQVLAILSAHEIRDKRERIQFFKELNRVTKADGRVVVVEHLRDLPNFLAFSLGFFHFHSKADWMSSFVESDFESVVEQKITPFISIFILNRYAHSS